MTSDGPTKGEVKTKSFKLMVDLLGIKVILVP